MATDLTDELSAFRQECEEQTARYKKLMQTKGKELFVKVVKGFFDATPQVAQVSWTQYTPYFNDGEACEFGVNEPQFLLHGEHEKDDVPYSENSINEKYALNAEHVPARGSRWHATTIARILSRKEAA